MVKDKIFKPASSLKIMPNGRIKQAIENLHPAEKRLLTDALQFPYANPEDDPFGFQASRIVLVSRLEEILSDIKDTDGIEEDLSVLDNGSLIMVYYGILSTGDLPKKLGDAMTNRELLCFFGGRGGACYSNLPEKVEVFPDEELYGMTIGCINAGVRYFKRLQPGLEWQDNGYTKSIPFDENTPIH